MKLQFDYLRRQIIDSRAPSDSILAGDISLKYTLSEDDITKGEKPSYTPYADREGAFAYHDGVFQHGDTQTVLNIDEHEEGLLLTLSSHDTRLSEFGLCLPINFMGKKTGDSSDAQFLFNSSYESEDGRIVYAYLVKPNGNNIGVAMLSAGDGWKMDYSQDAYAHFFNNLNFYANFDRAYQTERKPNYLQLFLFPTTDFPHFLDRLSRIYDLPFLYYDQSGAAAGETVALSAYGRVDELRIRSAAHDRTVRYSERFTIPDEGIISVTPICEGEAGAEVTLFGYSDIIDLYKRAMKRITSERMGYKNLCEWQCWIPALLRFLLRYGDRLDAAEISALEEEARATLRVIMATEEEKAVPHLTVFRKAHENFPAFHVYKSDRIQEQAFGVTIFLDAYRYFGEDRYLEYAVQSLNTLLDHHRDQDGAIRRMSGHDFSTVCAPMIPILDMANFFRGRDGTLYKKYFEAAGRLAQYLYRRGFNFPTESAASKHFGDEVEEGSISCTALSLLYYCAKGERTEEYITFAKELLDYHENWIIRTPRAESYRSTLRWWETLWEGDATGPSICAGHSWTLWRAEADYWYYALTGSISHREKAWASFMTNLSKVEANGRMTAVYTPDLIAGGGFAKTADEVRFRIEPRHPEREGGGLVHYLWIRLGETFLGELS